MCWCECVHARARKIHVYVYFHENTGTSPSLSAQMLFQLMLAAAQAERAESVLLHCSSLLPHNTMTAHRCAARASDRVNVGSSGCRKQACKTYTRVTPDSSAERDPTGQVLIM